MRSASKARTLIMSIQLGCEAAGFAAAFLVAPRFVDDAALDFVLDDSGVLADGRGTTTTVVAAGALAEWWCGESNGSG